MFNYFFLSNIEHSIAKITIDIFKPDLISYIIEKKSIFLQIIKMYIRHYAKYDNDNYLCTKYDIYKIIEVHRYLLYKYIKISIKNIDNIV